MKLSPRTAQVNFRISPDLKKLGEEAAEHQNRSLSSLLETLLIAHLSENGLLPPKGKKGGKRK